METQAECDKHRKNNRDSTMRKRQTETDEQGAKRKMTMQECVSNNDRLKLRSKLLFARKLFVTL